MLIATINVEDLKYKKAGTANSSGGNSGSNSGSASSAEVQKLRTDLDAVKKDVDSIYIGVGNANQTAAEAKTTADSANATATTARAESSTALANSNNNTSEINTLKNIPVISKNLGSDGILDVTGSSNQSVYFFNQPSEPMVLKDIRGGRVGQIIWIRFATNITVQIHSNYIRLQKGSNTNNLNASVVIGFMCISATSSGSGSSIFAEIPNTTKSY